MALLAGAGWPADRPDQPGDRTTEKQSGFPAHYCFGLERGRPGPYGAGAVPCIFSVLCGGWQTILPTVPAQRRYFSRRAVQYRFVCLADAHDRAADAAGTGRVYLDRRRLPFVLESPRTGGRTTGARAENL